MTHLEFLTTTRPFHEATNDESRRIVRSHAIRDANRRKRLNLELEESSRPMNSPSSTPVPQSNLTLRFRLDSRTPRRAAKPKTAMKREEEDKTAVSQSIHAISRLNTAKRFSKSRRESQVESIEAKPGRDILMSAPRPQNAAGFITFRSGDFDPFQTLSIKIEPKQQALLHYQKVSLKQNAFAFFSEEQLFSHVAVDPAWLNATLSLIALHKDLKVGQGISRECLTHRGEALRLVNERLATSPHEVEDATLGAIAALASFDITNGSLKSATMHMNGIEQILTGRGLTREGLFLLNANALLQKTVAWVDLSYASAQDLSPRYALMSNEVCRGSIPEFLEIFTPHLSPPFSSCHDLPGEMSDVFQSLRLLSYFMSRPSISSKDQKMFSRGLYLTEYKLLVMLDENVDDELAPLDRNSHLYGSTRLAAYLYLYMALRELPRTTKINFTLATRLKGILECSNVDLLLVWNEDLHLLLWILFIGAVATYGTDERRYFVGQLSRLTVHVGITSLASIQGALRAVLWLKEFSGPESTALWMEVSSSAVIAL